VHTAEREFFAVYDFSVAAFVDFAAAMSADVEAGFDGDGDEFCESLEKSGAEFSAFLGEFEDFAFFFAHRLKSVLHQTFFFQLLEEGVDEAWAYFFFDAFLEAADYLVAVGWSFVEYGEYVEA
jgi:hypothetical protein